MATIGIIGGSGFYELLENPEFVDVDTDYGKPSDSIAIGKIEGVDVAFLPRHGRKHTIPPHKVPYKANIEALSKLGVTAILSSCAVGSLKPEFTPGDLILFDQFINMTSGRDDTFFNGPEVMHVSLANPYCPVLTAVAKEAVLVKGMKVVDSATVVIINGPRFSTKAESRLFAGFGDLINMTQYPEVALAREKSICFLGIGIVTDYDVGLEGDPNIEPVSFEQIDRAFKKSTARLKSLIADIVKNTPAERNCECKNALKKAAVNPGA